MCCALQQAEQRVEREVARRLEVIGADESLWPAAAREALARQVNKLENMHTVLASLQNELDTEQHTVAALQATNQTLQASRSPAEVLVVSPEAVLKFSIIQTIVDKTFESRSWVLVIDSSVGLLF